MKTSLLLASMALVLGFLHAQAEPGSAVPAVAAEAIEQDVSPTAQVAKRQDARSLVSAFLRQKNLSQGFNAARSCYIVVGYGDLPVPPSHASYMDARLIAFEKAMLSAKAQMAEFMEQTIETAAESRILKMPTSKGEDAATMAAQSMAEMPEQTIVGKAVRLIHAKLDNALRQEGVDIGAEGAAAATNREQARRRLNALKTSDTFRRTVKSAAACAISGLQAYHTVEAWDGKKGSIAVVAIWSPKLSEMAASMVTGSAVSKAKAKRPINEQVNLAEQTLLSSFGVQQLIDENGNLVLVSYGQSIAEDEDDQLDIDLAYEQAALQAQGHIRDFAGEAVATGKELDTAAISLKFRDGSTPEYANESSYTSFKRSAAAAMACNGIQKVSEWEAVHPLTGKTVYGVVCSWSTNQAEFARGMKARVEETAKQGALGQRKIPTPPAKGAKGNDVFKPKTPARNTDRPTHFLNSGAAGDDDAF